ncbi:hypothetical protein [Sphingosinicella sp. BN140058]|uniref:hypothetical protein n=1 Tax=Sphingosinicella sp. BN140058 TaxID=1892855 RepID=UPI001010B952|nr:hypothetical protein [Sphingosinicella sp. BN140058]QAY80443.1 hypothetical protein ETR14_27780 [Sphingosinicella sp. BN140058]
MQSFEATFSYNVRRFVRKTVEAATREDAIAQARAMASGVIDADSVALDSTPDFGSAAGADAALFIDDDQHREVLSEELPDID